MRSDVHILSWEVEKDVARALQEESIIQQLQQIGEQEKMKNRMAIKALIRCTHFLAHRHIPHMTNFDQLVDLIVSSLKEVERMPATRPKQLLLNS